MKNIFGLILVMAVLPFLGCVSKPLFGKGVTSRRTVLVFLVDGLSVSTLQAQISAGRLPSLQSFFLGKNSQFFRARTGFPSLTYPSMSSLLMETSVDQTKIYGNQVLLGDDKINLEMPVNYRQVNKRFQGNNIFRRIKAKGLTSLSLDPVFHADVDSYVASDLNTGAAIVAKNYRYVDEQTLANLESAFADHPAQEWPDFIFVHLVGVDFLSHDFGSTDSSVGDHLEYLDKKLQPILARLQHAEVTKAREILSVLTADHGFDIPVSQYVNMDDVFRKISINFKVLNEGRYLGFFYPRNWASDQRESLYQQVSSREEMDLILRGTENGYELRGHGRREKFQFVNRNCGKQNFALQINDQPAQCLSQIDYRRGVYPYLDENLALYFRSEQRPDVVLIPKPGVAFSRQYVGQHGGPTESEVYVPLLLHGAKLEKVNEVSPLRELLAFM